MIRRRPLTRGRRENTNLNWEMITGISGIAIGLISLWFTYRQVHLSERHDRLSVQPRITLAFHIDEKRDRYGWYMSNNGLGPAYFNAFQLFVDGKLMSSDAVGGWNEALRILDLNQIEDCFSVAWTPPDTSVSNGSGVDEPLLRLKSSSPLCKVEFLKLILSLQRLKVQIEYQSIYGETFQRVAQPTKLF